MSKRTKFIIVSVILGVLLWISSIISVDYRLGMLLSICGAAYFLCVWSLFDDLKGIEWLTLMILPVMFVLGSGLFANFLPQALPSMFGRNFSYETSILLANVFRGAYFLLITFALYGILLVENIFSVASIRTIQLFRAARSSNFVLTLVASLFFYSVALSLKVPFWAVSLICFGASFLLSFPSFWSVDLKADNAREVIRYSLWSSWLISFSSAILCFWPVKPFMGGLMLTSFLYVLLGILEQKMSSRTYFESLVEYLITIVIILLIGFFTTSWIG